MPREAEAPKPPTPHGAACPGGLPVACSRGRGSRALRLQPPHVHSCPLCRADAVHQPLGASVASGHVPRPSLSACTPTRIQAERLRDPQVAKLQPQPVTPDLRWDGGGQLPSIGISGARGREARPGCGAHHLAPPASSAVAALGGSVRRGSPSSHHVRSRPTPSAGSAQMPPIDTSPDASHPRCSPRKCFKQIIILEQSLPGLPAFKNSGGCLFEIQSLGPFPGHTGWRPERGLGLAPSPKPP